MLDTGPSALLRDAVPKVVLQQSAPIACALLVAASAGVAEAQFVGRLGVEALAALGLTLPTAALLMQLISAFVVSTTSGLARRLAAGDPHTRAFARNNLLAGLLATLFLTCSLWVACNFFTPSASRALQLAADYLQVWGLALPFVYGSMWCFAAVQAVGRTTPMGIGLTVQAALDAVLLQPLMFGVGALPGFGIRGAGAACVVSWVVVFASALYSLWSAPQVMPTRHAQAVTWRADLADTLGVAVPVCAAYVLGPVMSAVVTFMLGAYPPQVLATFAVFSRLEVVFAMVPRGLSMGSAALIAQSWGVNDIARVRESSRFVALTCIGWGIGACALIGLGARPIARFFLGPDVAAEVAWILALLAAGLPSYCALVAINTIDNSTGYARRTLALSVLRTVGLGLAFAYVGQRCFGLQGLVAGIPLASWSAALIGALWRGRTSTYRHRASGVVVDRRLSGTAGAATGVDLGLPRTRQTREGVPADRS